MFFGERFRFDLEKKTYVMGILNVTPDSFYDKGSYFSPYAAVEHALRMQEEGADIIDIGAMSTRPGSVPVTQQEEVRRLESVLSELAGKLTVPISVDTLYSRTAEFCLDAGAAVINDVSGVFDPGMVEVIRRYGAGWVVTHTGGHASGDTAEYRDGVVSAVSGFFEDVRSKAAAYGIRAGQICCDPGFGFAKDTGQNTELLKNLRQVKPAGAALLCGVSAKRFIGDIINEPNPEKRLYGTLAANIAAVYGGADIVRVHNVKEHIDALKVIDRVLRA